jgi:outer membrane protein assembly factor BamB
VRRRPALVAAVAAVAVLVAAIATGCSGADAGGDGTAARLRASTACTWPMAGRSLDRDHQTGCDRADAVGAATLGRLKAVWFTETRAEVTGAPAITDDSLYLGDWSGRIYALDRADGHVRWTRDTPPHPAVYAGQIPASPTVTEIGGTEAVVIASGRTVWALRAADGTALWHHQLGDPKDPEDPIEIEGSPAVAGGLVIVPSDVHEDRDHRSGLVALSLADGTVRWSWDPEAGKPAGGCGAVWGTPSVDLAAHLVVVGTGSCFDQASWNPYAEAIVGVDLRSGKPRWTYQPRTTMTAQDWDFAGAPNLFEIGDRPVAGLGSKDGHYYVVDRTDGSLVWKAEAVRQTADSDGFAFGGFIGATAIGPDRTGRLVVAGGTAVGDCPCQHAFDAATGKPRWQSPDPTGTYGASAAAGGVVFTAGVDQVLWAFDLVDGKVRWQAQLPSISASGPAIAGDLLAIGVGFREPGNDASPSGGVQAFRVLAPGEAAPPASTTTLPEGPAVTRLAPSAQDCVGAPCDVDFTLKDPPAGRHPTMTLEVTPDPLAITVKTTDLGDPADWLGAEGPAHDEGATVFAVFVTPRDDKPELGSIVCVLGADGSCTGHRIALPADAYTRLSLVALADASSPPTLTEGYDRLVTTHSFDPGLVPAP